MNEAKRMPPTRSNLGAHQAIKQRIQFFELINQTKWTMTLLLP